MKPVSVWSGSFLLFGVTVKCHTLSDGKRIIEAESMEALLNAMLDGDVDPRDDAAFNEAARFYRWRQGS